jgi:hypothetical protein
LHFHLDEPGDDGGKVRVEVSGEGVPEDGDGVEVESHDTGKSGKKREPEMQ